MSTFIGTALTRRNDLHVITQISLPSCVPRSSQGTNRNCHARVGFPSQHPPPFIPRTPRVRTCALSCSSSRPNSWKSLLRTYSRVHGCQRALAERLCTQNCWRTALVCNGRRMGSAYPRTCHLDEPAPIPNLHHRERQLCPPHPPLRLDHYAHGSDANRHCPLCPIHHHASTLFAEQIYPDARTVWQDPWSFPTSQDSSIVQPDVAPTPYVQQQSWHSEVHLTGYEPRSVRASSSGQLTTTICIRYANHCRQIVLQNAFMNVYDPYKPSSVPQHESFDPLHHHIRWCRQMIQGDNRFFSQPIYTTATFRAFTAQIRRRDA